MTKCDFCSNSVLNKEGKLICECKAILCCQEAVEKMMKYAELTAGANNTKTEKNVLDLRSYE